MLLLVVMKDDDGNANDDICPEAFESKNVWVSYFKVESIYFNGSNGESSLMTVSDQWW